MLKLAVALIATVAVIKVEAQLHLPGSYSQGQVPVQFSNVGGGGGYHVGAPQTVQVQSIPQHQQHGGPVVPVRVKQGGPSKIFGWLGSRLQKLPSFFPKMPQFPKYKPFSQPNYHAVVVQDGGPQKYASPGGRGKPHFGGEKVKIYGPSFGPPKQFQPTYASPQYVPAPQNPNLAGLEVVPSQLLSYEKEIISGDGRFHGASSAPGSYGPPRQSGVRAGGHVPIVPQSNGPDYFDTAYQQEHYSQQQHRQQQYSGGDQGVGASQNFGATFSAIRTQGVPQIYDASMDLSAVGGPVIDSASTQADPSGYMQGGPYSATPSQDASLSSIISSLTRGSGGQSYEPTTAFSQVSVVTAHPNSGGESSPGHQQIVPGVQLVSSGTQDGNPMFEVVADANAPSFNGHPFDINKLLAMIEPGAQLEASPQLSESASEQKPVFVELPTAEDPSGTAAAFNPGTGDLLQLESNPEISQSPLIAVSPTRGINQSSIMELMNFFQNNKGYVIVERKQSNLTDTDVVLDDDDDLTHGPSRLNITVDNVPSINSKDTDTLINSIRPPITKQSNPNTSSASSSTSSPYPPHKPYVRPPVRFPMRRRKPYVHRIRTGTTTTTEHPNHNYNISQSVTSSSNDTPVSVIPVPTINPFLDMIHHVTPNDDDMAIEESRQVKSIAITVTPPPHLLKDVTTQASVSKNASAVIPADFFLSSTQKTTQIPVPKASKSRPAPVYRGKSAGTNNTPKTPNTTN